MMSTTTRITRLNKMVCLLSATFLLTSAAHAQLSLKRQKYNDIAATYKDEHAVYTDVKEKLIITDEDGALNANSYNSVEKLYISDLSLNRDNRDYFTHGELFELTGFDGVTYTPEKNDYKRSDNNCHFGEGGLSGYLFYDDQRFIEAYYTHLTKKSISNTTYSLNYPDVHFLYFNSFGFKDESLPILHAAYEVTTPDYVKMGFALTGMDTDIIKKTVTKKDGKITYTFSADNQPAFKSYSGVPGGGYYTPHVIPYIISFKRSGAAKDSVLAGNKDELYRNVHQFVNGINIKTDDGLNKKVAELTRNAYSDREKAAKIYEWVQDNMHYIAIENGMEGFIPRQADSVFKRKYGDCKDMASILYAMCRKAGLKAYFTLIGTKSIPYMHDEVPLGCLYNHMICAVNINDEWIFLDGTDKYLPFGANREDLQGKEALVEIGKKEYKIIKIPVVPADKNVTTDNTTMTINYNNVTGNVSQHYTGYEAWDLENTLAFLNKKDDRDKYVRRITKRGTDNYLIPQYNVDATRGGDMDVSVTGSYSLPGYAQMGTEQKVSKYYVNMNVLHTFPVDRINDVNRTVPYYISHKEVIRENVELNIPSGYKVTYLPKDAQGSIDGLWNYKISYKANKKTGKILLTKEYELNTMSVSPEKFDANNKMVDDLRNLYKETVVLTGKK